VEKELLGHLRSLRWTVTTTQMANLMAQNDLILSCVTGSRSALGTDSVQLSFFKVWY
jgi:hypothetical protein